MYNIRSHIIARTLYFVYFTPIRDSVLYSNHAFITICISLITNQHSVVPRVFAVQEFPAALIFVRLKEEESSFLFIIAASEIITGQKNAPTNNSTFLIL